MISAAIIGLILAILVFAISAFVIRRAYSSRSSSARARILANRGRPAQPEPGETGAVQSPEVREVAALAVPGGEAGAEAAQQKERRRQLGQ